MSKKAIALLATILAAGVGAFGAYAYWTAHGAGSGTATAGSAPTNLEIGASGFADLTIGNGGHKPVRVVVHNPNPFSSRVNTVTYTGMTAVPGTCDPSWFNLGTGDGSARSPYAQVSHVELNVNLAADDAAPLGPDQVATTGFGTLTLKDLPGTDQNACQGAVLTLNFTSN
jgi:hypothetical protein